MGDTTHIGWTQKTWNPWHGCQKISPGCKNCYMFREKRQYGQEPTHVVRSKTTFAEPLKWKEPSVVFICSWSDWFIEDADDWRDAAWDVIRSTPHTYQILTKRSDRIAGHLPPDWPLPNVWLGVSVESQAYVYRIDDLLKVPAAVHFVSYEPALGPLDLSERIAGLQWVIAGGESGPGRRPCEIGWFQALADQCTAADVSLFMKQDTGAKAGQQGRIPDALWARKDFP